MLEELGGTLLAEILLTKASGLPVVVVEGDLDYEYLTECRPVGAEVVNARGKQFILDEIEEILAADESVTIVMDRDFDAELGRLIDHPAVIYTDRYNLEAVFLCEPTVAESLWRQLVKPSERGAVSFDKVYQFCMDSAAIVGTIRYCSTIKDWGLNMKRFPVAELSNLREQVHGGCADMKRTAELAVRRSPKCDLVQRRRRRKADGYLERTTTYVYRETRRISTSPTGHLVSGHDFVRFFHFAISQHKKSALPTPEDLERHAMHVFVQLGQISVVDEALANRLRTPFGVN